MLGVPTLKLSLFPRFQVLDHSEGKKARWGRKREGVERRNDVCLQQTVLADEGLDAKLYQVNKKKHRGKGVEG